MPVHGDVTNNLLFRYFDRSMTVHRDVINYFLLRYLERSMTNHDGVIIRGYDEGYSIYIICAQVIRGSVG